MCTTSRKMKEELVGFEVAELAREKGFDWDCNANWKTYEQVLEAGLLEALKLINNV